MNRNRRLLVLAVMLTFSGVLPAADPAVTTEERARLERGLTELNRRLAKLMATSGASDHLADVEVYAKGVAWALHDHEPLTPADVARLHKALERGHERAAALEAGKHPWTAKEGKVVRAFVSAVDGSVQPYGVVVPARYDPARPTRLDVVLHGSSRPSGMSELNFLSRFDEGDANAPEQEYLELHPLGRVENAYRWAGETDVFEAIEAACHAYHVDRDRIVLRGMSMGASGTWHLGLKHPDRFVALGPYCGYVDTHQFSQTPLPNFVKVGPLPPYQEKGLHLLDSVDYAANAGVVPVVACMGEKDVFFQAHVLMGRAMEREGLKLVNLISPGTGHVIDPVTQKEQLRCLGEYAAKGIDHAPRHLHFVTWTLKYNTCHWVRVLGLGEHYTRAELVLDVADDGSVTVQEARNVTLFAVCPPVAPKEGACLYVGGRKVGPLPRGEGRPPEFFISRRGETWEMSVKPVQAEGKRPGVQGPIDDAFTTPFLCVRGTGRAWNPAVQTWAEASLERFAHEWRRYFRGELRIKDDTAVTEEDLRRYNLVLFGDPGSNAWIAKALPRLPLRWTPGELRLGKDRYAAGSHAPVLIQPSPFARDRYVVLNSGHTFHEKELASLNYLLFPHLGDWAVMRIGDELPKDPSRPLEEHVVRAGFFDEGWGLSESSVGAGNEPP